MGIPIFMVITIIIIAILITTIFVYFQVYKRHINKALSSTTRKHNSMAPPYTVAIVMTAIVLIIGIFVSYYAGYFHAYKNYEADIWEMSTSAIQTYYANVKEVGEHHLLVEGIAINDKAYQGEFRYEVVGEVYLEQNGTPITLTDLETGDLVSIILLTDRFGITDIFKIQLLPEGK